MPRYKARKPAIAVSNRRLHGTNDQAGQPIFPVAITPKNFRQAAATAPIRAELIGSVICTAEGITACGHSPVLKLCRQLIAAGFDPARPLLAYRDGTLALRISSLGQVARLTVKSAGNGGPTFVLDGARRGAGGSPIRAKRLRHADCPPLLPGAIAP